MLLDHILRLFWLQGLFVHCLLPESEVGILLWLLSHRTCLMGLPDEGEGGVLVGWGTGTLLTLLSPWKRPQDQTPWIVPRAPWILSPLKLRTPDENDQYEELAPPSKRAKRPETPSRGGPRSRRLSRRGVVSIQSTPPPPKESCLRE